MRRTDKRAKSAPLKDARAVAAADVVRNLGRVALVVHQEELEFPDV